MKILVTGASGNLGASIVEFLLKKISTSNIIAGVRDTQSEKAKALIAKGIEVRAADFENKAALVQAFQGVDRLFVVSTFGDEDSSIRQQTNAVQAAKEAGVTQIVYSSAPSADISEFFLARIHRIREEIIKASGISYVFVRNNWYVENELATIQQCLDGSPWVTSAGEGKVGWVYRPDLAEATANILVGEGHDNKAYELSGESLTQQQFVDALNEVTQKNIPLLAVDDTAFGEMLRATGLPEDLVNILVMTQQGIREGGLENTTSDLTALLGRKPTSVKQALQQLLN